MVHIKFVRPAGLDGARSALPLLGATPSPPQFRRRIVLLQMAESEVSLQDLVERFKLSNHQLDAEVSDEHLRKASRIIADHKILGPEVGLSSAEMTAIDQQPPEHQRFAMLEKWKQKLDWKATYRKLIEALLRCSRADTARQVCELLTQSK